MKKYLFKKWLNPSKNRESLWHLSYHLIPPSSFHISQHDDGSSNLGKCCELNGAPSLPSSQSRAMLSSQDGWDTSILIPCSSMLWGYKGSIPVKCCWENGVFFLHLALTHRAEALVQVRQAENTGTGHCSPDPI